LLLLFLRGSLVGNKEIKMSIEQRKAKQLFEQHGFKMSNIIVDAFLDENLPEFNQKKIDFYLDVKNELKRISTLPA